ncbi:AbgT family transporter [Marinilabiliaceae bacterium JC017]|nr:AbgT family transporter [Marinilabiliaceae bacterium JC017]
MFQKLKNINILGWVERAGNKLPHPATLFALFAFSAVILSWITHLLGVEAVHPATGEIIKPFNLISKTGIHRILEEMVDNFTGFAPLGIVIVAMLGIGIAESSGLIGAVIRVLVIKSPKKIITFVLVFSGVLSNMASDIGYVLLIPLAGAIFHSFGRHPIAGMAAAFSGVSGGFSANLLLGTIDPLLAGLSTEAAHILDPAYAVNPTANYYFMVVSTFLIAGVGTWITERIVEPRLGVYKGDVESEPIERLSKKEKKGILYALAVFAISVVIILIGIVPTNGFLLNPGGSLLDSPLLHAIISFLFLIAGGMGIAYGFGCGKYNNDADIMNGMGHAIKGLAGYIVLVFFAAQFVAYFKWSNLGVILAVKGAGLLTTANLGSIPLMLLFVLLSASINMLMGSASAKWAILAPVFIPMFMLLGYSPELSQVIYRIGDSVTNIISPMMSFFALIIAFMQKYNSKTGIGTIIATMLPYSIGFFIAWSLLLVCWYLLGLPLGPDAGVYYQLPK